MAERPSATPNRMPLLQSLRGAILMGIAWIFACLLWLPVLALAALSLRRPPDRLITAVARAWGRASLRLLGIRLHFDNPSPLTDRAPRVVIINHQSALDVFWCAAILPPGSLAIGKREIIYIPLLNIGWWALRYIRVDRQRPSRCRNVLRSIPDRIRNTNSSLMIAPEGTRTPNGAIGPFKAGAFRFAIASRAPIYPVVVRGAFQLMPKTRWFPTPGTLRLRFLEPINADTWEASNLNQHIDSVRRTMQEALDDMDRCPPG